MGAAIGFAVVIVTMGVLLPSVLHSLEQFLLVALAKAIELLEHINNF
jgi:hypothetical protein